MLSDQDENKKYLNSLTLPLLPLVYWCALKEGFIPLEDFQTLLNIIDMLLSCLSFPPLLDCIAVILLITESATCRCCARLRMP